MSRILLVEDEEKIARVLELELQHEGYEVAIAYDGRSGLELALSEPGPDLILLDIMLPEMSGLEVLRRIRQTHALLPVILLTARDAVPDRVSGLDQGANDYVTKPFAMEELLARIRGLLRVTNQQAESAEHVIQVDEVEMNLKSREVRRENVAIDLTPTEFELLRYLMQHVNEVVSREQILAEVWGYDFAGETNVVDVYIRYLRQKMEKGFSGKLLRTVRGVGYMLKSKQDEPGHAAAQGKEAETMEAADEDFFL